MAVTLRPIRQFTTLAENFTGIERDYQLANAVLDVVIANEYSDQMQQAPKDNSELFVSFIISGTRMLSEASLLLRSKFGQAVGLIIQNHKVEISGECCEAVTKFLAFAVEECKSSLVADFLNALVLVLSSCSGTVDEVTLDALLGMESPLWTLLSSSISDVTIHRKTVLCISTMLSRQDIQKENKFYIKVCYQKIVNHLRILLSGIKPDDVMLCKMILNALRCLQNVLKLINEKDGMVEAEFVLAILKIFTIYGLPGFQSKLNHLSKNLPSPSTAIERTIPMDLCMGAKKDKSPLSKRMATSTRQKKKKARNKNKKFGNDGEGQQSQEGDNSIPSSDHDFTIFDSKQTASAYSSSESELSDAESDLTIGQASSKVRHGALKCIQSVLESIDKRSKLACWLLLIPESYSDLDPSLLSFVENDPSPKVRIAAVMSLSELLNGSKIFLEHAIARYAENTQPSRAFIPFSVKLSQSIDQLHRSLISSLEQETHISTLDKVVKCLTLVILNCPYDKLGPHWLKKLVPKVSQFLNSKDQNLFISAMTCLAAVISVREKSGDLTYLFSKTEYPFGTDLTEKLKMQCSELELFGGSWLLYCCFKTVQVSEQEDQVTERYVSQSLQVMTVILRMYPELINSRARAAIQSMMLKKVLEYTSMTLAFDSVKLLEELGKYFAKDVVPPCDDTEAEAIVFWNKVLPGIVMVILQSSEVTVKVKAATCDWLATIGPRVFTKLEYRHQIMCKTLLLGTSQDGDPQIKAAAVRALGLIITYPCMTEDPAFVVDSGNILLGYLNSTNLTLQMKAAWALGNLCDACVKNRLIVPSETSYGLSEDFVFRLLRSSIQISEDNDKVKSNGARALGNLIRCLPKCMLETEKFQDVLAEAANTISKNVLSGPMKGRWNACYACSNIFQNPDINIGQSSWKKPVLLSLVTSLKECKNFKVRISAASAILLLNKRSCFGDKDMFCEFWTSVLQALVSSESMTDFLEFRYKDTLQTQICELICHLLSLASSEDLDNIQHTFPEYSKLLTVHMNRYFGNSDASSEVISISDVSRNEQQAVTSKPEMWEAVKSSLLQVTSTTDIQTLIKQVDDIFL